MSEFILNKEWCVNPRHTCKLASLKLRVILCQQNSKELAALEPWLSALPHARGSLACFARVLSCVLCAEDLVLRIGFDLALGDTCSIL